MTTKTLQQNSEALMPSSDIIKDTMAKVDSHAADLASTISKISVYDKGSMEVASEKLILVKNAAKRLEDLRKGWTSPLNNVVKWINGQCTSRSDKFEYLEKILKEGINIYLNKEEQARREEAERINKEQIERERMERQKLEEAKMKELALQAAAQEEANVKKQQELIAEAQKAAAETKEAAAKLEEVQGQVQLVEQPIKNVRTEAGVVSRSLHWTWEVENVSILMRAHPELFIIDTKAVNKLVNGGERNIAGLRIFQESRISGRSN